MIKWSSSPSLYIAIFMSSMQIGTTRLNSFFFLNHFNDLRFFFFSDVKFPSPLYCWSVSISQSCKWVKQELRVMSTIFILLQSPILSTFSWLYMAIFRQVVQLYMKGSKISQERLMYENDRRLQSCVESSHYHDNWRVWWPPFLLKVIFTNASPMSLAKITKEKCNLFAILLKFIEETFHYFLSLSLSLIPL